MRQLTKEFLGLRKELQKDEKAQHELKILNASTLLILAVRCSSEHLFSMFNLMIDNVCFESGISNSRDVRKIKKGVKMLISSDIIKANEANLCELKGQQAVDVMKTAK